MDDINIKLSNALRIKERIPFIQSINENENYRKWIERKSLVKPENRMEILNLSNLSEKDMNIGTGILDEESELILFNEVVKKSDWYIIYKHIMENFEISKIDTIEKVISPMINYASNYVEKLLKKNWRLNFSDSVKNDLLTQITQELLKFFVKPLIVEFNKAKIDKTENYEYSDYMANELNTKEQLIKFYAMYPVSLRITVTKLQYLINNIEESIIRLNNHIYKLAEKFELRSKYITKINCFQGDSHERAKSVMIITFEDNKKIVYKPKNLEIVSIFQNFIKWINSNSSLKNLYTFQFLTFEGYHYEEYLENTSARNLDEVKEYYEKFGYYIAIFHLLCGNDLHLENIIASRKGPIPIDLETLFQNKIPLNMPNMAGVDVKYDISVESVLGTSLLPIMGFTDNKEGKGIDISALNGKKSKLPFKVLVPKDINTRNFRYEYDYVCRPGSKNELFYNKNKVEFHEYSQLVIEGFCSMISFFQNNKNIVTKELKKFKNCTVRNVIKPTSKYMHLLEFSYHPNYLKDMLEREHLLENNWAYPYIKKEVVISEINDMIFDDIPIFYSKTDEKKLFDSNKNVINNYFGVSGLEKALGRLNSLTNEYIEKQKDIIIVSLGLYNNELEKLKGQYEIKITSRDIEKPIKEETILNYVEKLAKNIYEQAYKRKTGEVTWSNINQVINKWEIGPMEVGLYRGLSGIALLYLELYNYTHKRFYKEIYDGILKNIFLEYKNFSEISAFTGGVSIAFLLLREEEIIGTNYFEKYNEIIKFIDKNLDSINGDDLISGKAGILSLISEVYLKHPNKFFNNVANELIEKIIDNTSMKKIGFGHGNSGIALSLLKASKVFNVTDDNINKKIIELIEYENKNIKEIDKYTWCNGTTGIGLARLEMSRICISEELNRMILCPLSVALENIQNVNKNDDCFCHGNMGDIELLFKYYIHTNNKDIYKLLNIKLNNFFEKEKINIRGLTRIHENNLFLGKSGIAFELLSLINPFDVSSPLLYRV